MLILRTSRGPPSLRSGAHPLAEVAQFSGFTTPLNNGNTNDFDLPVAQGTSLDVFIADREEACPVSLQRNVGPGRNNCQLVDLGPAGEDRVPAPPPALPPPVPIPSPPAQAVVSSSSSPSPSFAIGPPLMTSSSSVAVAVTASGEASKPSVVAAPAIQSTPSNSASSLAATGPRRLDAQGSEQSAFVASTGPPRAGEANEPTPSTRLETTDQSTTEDANDEGEDDGSKRKGIIVAISVTSFLLLLTLLILYLFSRRRRQRSTPTSANSNRNSYTVDLSRQPSTIKQHVVVSTEEGAPPSAWSTRRSRMASGTVTLSARTRTSVDSDETLHPPTSPSSEKPTIGHTNASGPVVEVVPPSPARSLAPFTNLARGEGEGGGLFNIWSARN